MRDVEDQLRIYGDAIETEQANGPHARTVVDVATHRPRRGLLVASALVIVVALLAGGASLVTRDRSHGTSAVRTSGTRQRSTSGKITASLRLDKTTVHQGEDILGTVTFNNRTGHVVAYTSGSNACLGRWQVALGKDSPDRAAEYPDCDTAGTNRRALKFQPGRHRLRILLPTTFNSCGERGEPKCGGAPLQAPLLPSQRTNVWLVTPKSVVQAMRAHPLKIISPPTPRFCVAKNLAVGDGGPIPTTTLRPPGIAVHRLVVMNVGRRGCQLDGDPATWVTTSSGNTETPLAEPSDSSRRRIILRPKAQASFLADIVLNHVFAVPLVGPINCGALQIHVRLPDHGGTIELAPDPSGVQSLPEPQPFNPDRSPPGLKFSTWPATLACATSITVLTGFVPGAHADATLLDQPRPPKRRA